MRSRRSAATQRSIRDLPSWLSAIGGEEPASTPALAQMSVPGRERAEAPELRPHGAHTSDLDVVVLDDEHPIRTLVRVLLKRAAGLRFAAEASDTAQDVELLREMQPHVVLVDLGVPGRYSDQVLSRIIEVAPESMVLVMSGLDASQEAEAAFQQGAFAYLEKTRLGAGLAEDLRALYQLFERARNGEDVWADEDVSRVLR